MAPTAAVSEFTSILQSTSRMKFTKSTWLLKSLIRKRRQRRVAASTSPPYGMNGLTTPRTSRLAAKSQPQDVIISINSVDFKVRNPRLNPIYKNTIYELMFKDPKRRITLADALKRISLHQFIKIDEQSKVTKGSTGGSLQGSRQL